MYQVEIYEKCRLIDVAIYEKLENAIYESTHTKKGLFKKVDEKRQCGIQNTKIEATIFNDWFRFRWKCGVEVIIRKMIVKDSEEIENHLMYEGKVYYGELEE